MCIVSKIDVKGATCTSQLILKSLTSNSLKMLILWFIIMSSVFFYICLKTLIFWFPFSLKANLYMAKILKIINRVLLSNKH